MTDWYYSDYERNRHGPVSANDLAQLHANGQLEPDTLVWREGLAQWQPWRSVADEVLGDATRSAAASASYASPEYASASPAETRSPYAPPSAPLLRAGGVHRNHEVVYAGFWKRVAAYIIDAVILGVVGAITGAMIGGIMGVGGSNTLAIQAVVQLFSVAIGACYYAFFHASAHQATPGKMAIGIKVVRGDGQGISFLRGIGRYFAYIVSGLVLLIGLAMAGFTERKRALHDMMCDTLVVDKWAFTDQPEAQRQEMGGVAITVLVLGGLLFFGIMALAIAGIGAMSQLGG